MRYSSDQISHLFSEHTTVLLELDNIFLETVSQAQNLSHDDRAKEYLLHGVGRRLSVIKRAIQNIFEKFPPDSQGPLDSDVLVDVQLNLHAFVINLCGIFDNWAWAFVLRHVLGGEMQDRRKIDLFKPAMQAFLPKVIKDYLTSDIIAAWQKEYLKNYRDALAHRVPLYIPPAVYTPEKVNRYNNLENEKIEALKDRDFLRFNRASADQEVIGEACFTFQHSHSDGSEPRLILLHPQVICDGKAVAEFGHLYLAHWHQHT
ncbi:MAG: hypothetical protein ACRES7_07670 [Gammaproteobacteria bacterium]